MVIRSSNKNKRKGDDNDLVSAFNRSVVFSPRNTSAIQDGVWLETKNRLTGILELCGKDGDDDKDELLYDIATTQKIYECSFQENLKQALEKATVLQSKLEAQIGQVNLHLRDEAAAATALQEQIETILTQNETLEQQSQETVQHSQQLQKEIDEYKSMIQEHENSKDSVQAQRRLKVPRLQQQISLYANITGIKWDYERQEQLQQDGNIDTHLVGQVNIPSKKMVQHFEIDRQELSRFDVANRLWALIEGGGETADAAVGEGQDTW